MAQTVSARLREVRNLVGVQRVGNLQQDAGSVAAVLFRATGAAVVEIGKQAQAVRDQGVGGVAGQIDEGADPATRVGLGNGAWLRSVSLWAV